ncbi:MAG: tRNA pseudouridine(55) synthase TruB [Puniceicoccales bacterium]|jgi:tRNA pseudouridine55 synthase|nr:tRNA pseudouridine(55) synthase TruB [Puniceicoccales bacterium]
MTLKANCSNSLDGILLIDKPWHWTSFDVIRYLRRQFCIAKIGHAGTLDPAATGLLTILFGRATRLFQSLMCLHKTYEGTIQLGVETSTYDLEGEVTKCSSTEGIQLSHVVKAMDSFLGDQYQIPPMFSAKKLNGTPLYKLARKGKEVERTPHLITIFQFHCVSYMETTLRFHIQCSKGTYVRSLAFDLGRKLGCGAHLTGLRRVQNGPFSIDQAIALKALENKSFEDLQTYVLPYENFCAASENI